LQNISTILRASPV